MRKPNHYGIPTTIPREGEMYSEDMKLFMTDYNTSPNRIEFLRFDADFEMPDILKTHAHIAYEVDSLEEEMAGKPVIMAPTVLSSELTIAFVEEEGIAIELMLITK